MADDSEDYIAAGAAEAHASTHEAGGSDELDITGLTPADHASRHELGGADEIDVSGLVGVGHQLVDRGDPVAVDFAIGDFTTDQNWNVWDFSGIVPVGTISVKLNISITDNIVQSDWWARKYGNINPANVQKATTYVINIPAYFYWELFLDSSRRAEYKFFALTPTAANAAVLGWVI